ncbi:MAG: phosphotransferase enzyme family protein [Clostridium sp.]
MEQKCNFKEIVSNFEFEGKLLTSENHFCGLINDTYFVDFDKEDGQVNRYVLQKINTDVFTNAERLMDNISKVTSHISNKVKESGGDHLRESLNLVKTLDGKSYYKTHNGEYWRSFLFIDGAKTYMMVQKPEDFYTCGKAVGKFQKYLSDFEVSEMYETIPDFHNTAKRYEAFKEAVEKDVCGRVAMVSAEIDYIMTRAEDTKKVVDLIASGDIPLRVTHNDTKYNNIMIDDVTGEGICVIDLDTVMPGSVLYDFGDAIRSGATTAEEDEADLSKVNFDINLFEQFTKGFLESVGGAKGDLTAKEIELLPFSCKLITLELAMRFLMDHISGDTYFRIARENHNLDRARNQLKLVSDMEEAMEEMKTIVNRYV